MCCLLHAVVAPVNFASVVILLVCVCIYIYGVFGSLVIADGQMVVPEEAITAAVFKFLVHETKMQKSFEVQNASKEVSKRARGII